MFRRKLGVVVAATAIVVSGTFIVAPAPPVGAADGPSWWGRVRVETQYDGSGQLGDCPGDSNFYDCMTSRKSLSLHVAQNGDAAWSSYAYERRANGYPGICEVTTTSSHGGFGVGSGASIDVVFDGNTYGIDTTLNPTWQTSGDASSVVSGVPECFQAVGSGGHSAITGRPGPVFPVNLQATADPDSDHLSGSQTVVDGPFEYQVSWSLYRVEVDCEVVDPLPDLCLTPELSVSTTANTNGPGLRPTTHRRVEPGVQEVDPSVAYARFNVDVAVPESADDQAGPFYVDLATGDGLVPVGADDASVAAGWSCEVPEPDTAANLPTSCTLEPDEPLSAGQALPALVVLADVGWEALPGTDVHARAWFGASEVADEGPTEVPVGATIVGMGDSFSSGEGSGSYPPPADRNRAKGGCHRSPRSWQHVWATGVLEDTDDPAPPLGGYVPGFVHVACSGALSDAVGNPYSGPGDGGLDPPEDPQIEALDRPDGVDAVVATFGGNDAFFGDIVQLCMTSGSLFDDCDNEDVFAHDASGDKVTRKINSLFPGLVEVFQAIRGATSPSGDVADPDSAAVYVSGYPLIVPAAAESFCYETGFGALSTDERSWIREKVTEMDTVLAAAARQAGVHYLSVLPIFEDNWYCQDGDGPAAMNGVSSPASLSAYGTQEAFHPTSVGFGLWGRAALAAAPTPSPNPAPENVTRPGPYDHPLTRDDFRADEVDADGTAASVNAERILTTPTGVAIPIGSWLPGTTVSVALASDPVDLGEFPVNEHGVATVEVPGGLGAQLDPGLHHLVVSGTGSGGAPGVWLLTLPVVGEVPTDGTITGTVTVAGSGAPVPGSHVAVLRTGDFSLAGGSVAAANGEFSVVVPDGSYYLYLIDSTGAHRAGFYGSPTTVSVDAGAVVHTDPTMVATRGSVTGTITETGTGAPVQGAWAVALSTAPGSTGALEAAVVADQSGAYELGGLTTTGHYIGFVDPMGGHAPRFHPDSPNVPHATPVAVSAGTATPLEGSLPSQGVTGTGAEISGTVTVAGTGSPLEGAIVMALRAADFAMVRGTITDGAGQYTLDVAAGAYKLAVADSTGSHDMEWFDDLPSTSLGDAVSVVASADPAPTDVALNANTGSLAGLVVDADNGNPLAGAWVFAIGPAGIAGGAVSATDGTYTITGLPPGTYRATAVDTSGDRPQEYWPDSPTYDGATPFAIVAAATTTADIVLGHS